MPPGPRKRRRQRKVSADEAHESDGTTSCPDTPDQGNRMSSSLGTPSDRTFQTEDWLRGCDFDVGTPSSTTADSKGDYDVATEESYGDVRGNDKLADWETVSRDTVGASSTEDVAESMEADHSVLEESVSSSQGQKLKLLHVDKGNSECLSHNQDDHEKISPSSQSSSTKSEDLEKTSSCSETGSPGVEEDQEPACIEEFEQINQENGSTEAGWQQEHENAKLTSSMGVRSEKLQDLECIKNVSLPEAQQEDHHSTDSRQEDNTIIGDALEEDASIQGTDIAISGMDGTSDQSIEAVDMAPLKLQEDNVKDIPEQKHDELDQLVDIAHSTELAYLAKQEESLLALEEKDLGKTVSEPLANMLAPAQDSSEALQNGEGEDLKMVILEETPLVQDSPAAVDAMVSEEAEPVAMKELSLIQHHSDGNDAGVSEEAEDSINDQESALVEQSPNADTDAFPGEYVNTHLSDHLSTAGHTLQTDSPPAEREKDNVIQQKSSCDPELPRTHARVRTNGADLGRGLSLGSSGGTPVDLTHYNSPKKSEEQVKPKERWDGSSEIGGCCEPVHWILNRFFGRCIN